jgi:phage gp36-like protein
MAYVSLTDVELAAGGPQKLLQLADWSGAGSVDQAVIAAAIAEAVATVNRAIQLRYGVPLGDPVPQVVRTLVAREAVFAMKLSRGMVSEADQLAHDERMATLKSISEGRTALGVTPVPLKSTYVVDRVSDQADNAPVSRESLKGFS